MTATLNEPVRDATRTEADSRRMSDCEFDLAVRWFLAVSRNA